MGDALHGDRIWRAESLLGQRPSGPDARDRRRSSASSPGRRRLRRFPDSEVSFQIDENIRGTDVFIVQPTCQRPRSISTSSS